MMKKIHINDLEKQTNIEGKINIPLGTEIEFDVPMSNTSKIPLGTEIEFDVPKQKSSNNLTGLKKWLIAGTIAAATIMGYAQLKKEEPNKIDTEFNETIPKNYVAGANHKGETFFFTKKDPLIRNTTGKQAYINLHKKEMNSEELYKSLNLLNQQTMAQLMKTSNLNSLYKKYTALENGKPNYEKALENLWLEKNSRWGNNFLEVGERIVKNYDSNLSKKTTFHDYKQNIDNELENIIGDLKDNGFLSAFHDEESGRGHRERKRFMENYLSSINGKIVMSYFLTELFPDINPAANIVFKNKLLKEAGEEFINGIPALSDSYLSMGPGQLTSYVINGSGAPALNKYLSEQNKIPESMDEFVSTEHHIKGSILNLKHNAMNFMNVLYINNQLTNFNNMFEELAEDDQKKLLAGHASAAHHATTLASFAYMNHTRNANNGLFDLANTQNIELGRLKQYHNQSLKNYFVLKEMKKENMFIK